MYFVSFQSQTSAMERLNGTRFIRTSVYVCRENDFDRNCTTMLMISVRDISSESPELLYPVFELDLHTLSVSF